jgi:hypothetical protein
MPATLTAKAKEALKMLESVPKFTWPIVPATGDIFEHIR